AHALGGQREAAGLDGVDEGFDAFEPHFHDYWFLMIPSEATKLHHWCPPVSYRLICTLLRETIHAGLSNPPRRRHQRTPKTRPRAPRPGTSRSARTHPRGRAQLPRPDGGPRRDGRAG